MVSGYEGECWWMFLIHWECFQVWTHKGETEERIAKVSVYIINGGLAGWKSRGIFLLLQFNLFELIYLKWQEWQGLSWFIHAAQWSCSHGMTLRSCGSYYLLVEQLEKEIWWLEEKISGGLEPLMECLTRLLENWMLSGNWWKFWICPSSGSGLCHWVL